MTSIKLSTSNATRILSAIEEDREIGFELLNGRILVVPAVIDYNTIRGLNCIERGEISFAVLLDDFGSTQFFIRGFSQNYLVKKSPHAE